MTVQSRGPRSRRGGRGPGGVLLTALLVLAILASSTLVFTNRVELLRLAVVLSLWAAVVAAFVTVIYRRQSDTDQARARDMKFVYDLQLDREISARREYELSVEARLRRQMSMESVQAADAMAALRAELASLRSHLEVMLGTDLAPRPALEGDRIAVPMPAAPGRVESSRVTVITEEIVEFTEETEDEPDFAAESPIIDVAEEPLTPAHDEPAVAPEPAVRTPYWRPERPEPQPERYVEPAPQQPEAPWRPPEARPARHGAQYPPRPEPVPPQSPPPPRGRHWVRPVAPPNPAGRHRGPIEPVIEQPAAPEVLAPEVLAPEVLAPEVSAPEPEQEPQHEPTPSQGQHADGQSFADLMERLKVDRPAGGGGRRRRED